MGRHPDAVKGCVRRLIPIKEELWRVVGLFALENKITKAQALNQIIKEFAIRHNYPHTKEDWEKFKEKHLPTGIKLMRDIRDIKLKWVERHEFPKVQKKI